MPCSRSPERITEASGRLDQLTSGCEHHMTILLASHDPQVAARADRLIWLCDGAAVDDIQLAGRAPYGTSSGT